MGSWLSDRCVLAMQTGTVAEAETVHPRQIGLGLGEVVDAVGAVQRGRDRIDLFPERRAIRRELVERARPFARGDHGLREVDGALASLGEATVHDHRLGAGPGRELADQLDLGVRVGGEVVDRHDARQAVLPDDADVRREVVDAPAERIEVLRAQVIERHAAVGLRRADRRDQHAGRRGEPAEAAHDVAELLEAEIASRTRPRSRRSRRA